MLGTFNIFNGVFYTSSRNPNIPIINSLTAIKIKEGFVKIFYKGTFDYVNINCNNENYLNVVDNSYNISNLICDTSYDIFVTPFKNSVSGNTKKLTIKTKQLLMSENSINVTTLTNFKNLSSSNNMFGRNIYSSGGAGYSLRKINKDYNGYCIKIYRTSDGSYCDIGFKNYVVDINAILNFCGNENGFVQTWYDQFNSFNLIQDNPVNYPQIVYNGSIIYLNGFPHIIFSGIPYHPYNDSSGTSFLFNKDMGFNPFKKFNLSVIGTKIFSSATYRGTFVSIDPYLNTNFSGGGSDYYSRFSVNSLNISDVINNRGLIENIYVTGTVDSGGVGINETFIYNIYLNDNNTNNFGANLLTCYSNFSKQNTNENKSQSLNIVNKFGVLDVTKNNSNNWYRTDNRFYNTYTSTYFTAIYDFNKISRTDNMVNYNNLLDISCGAFNLGCVVHRSSNSYGNIDFFGGIQEVIVGVYARTTNDLSNVYVNQQNYFFDNFYYFS